MLATETTTRFATELLYGNLWSELTPLMEAHCREIGPFPELVFNPHKKAYQRMQDHGALAVFTARQAGALVGYCAFFISPSLHYFPAIFAQADVLYVQLEHRTGFVGLGLMQHAHAELIRRWNVAKVFFGSKAARDKSIAPLLERMGYALVDHVHVKGF